MPQPGKPSGKSKPRVIAAIPSLNTESAIGEVVAKARQYVDRVIVINDGSHDGTAEKAAAAGATVINHQATKGYGEAIKSCFEVARASEADVLVILDGDGQHDPDEIPKLLDPVIKGEADVVIGSRFLSKDVGMPRYRKFGIGVITSLWNFGSRVKITDSQSGFRAYGSAAFRNLTLTERGMGASIEILEKARRAGSVIKEVPASCIYTSSKLTPKAARHGLKVALSVIRIRLKYSLFGE